MNTGEKVANKRFMTLLSLLKKNTKAWFEISRRTVSFITHSVHKVFSNSFMVKAKCRASMSTREIHDLEVSLDLTADSSGYCNHILSLLLELARYSLEELDRVPEKAACTSMSRKWGVSGKK